MHTNSPEGPGPLLPPAPAGKAPAGKEVVSPCPSPPDISPSTHLPGPLPSVHPASSAAPKTCSYSTQGGVCSRASPGQTTMLGSPGWPRPAGGQGRPAPGPGPAWVGPAGRCPAPPCAPSASGSDGQPWGRGLCLPHRPPIPGPEGSGEGEPAGGSGWGEGGARETRREGGDEDRKPDTVCVIKLRTRGALCTEQRARLPCVSTERFPAKRHTSPGRVKAGATFECAARGSPRRQPERE